MPDPIQYPISWKDPSGFVFRAGETYYRQVHRSYADDYTMLMTSGLYDELVAGGWMISHTEIGDNLTGDADWYRTLLPQQLPPFSWPFEWCFSQLRDAALHTLSIMSAALTKGMILKDATPFNIQFVKGGPLFIDTLSFERYDESLPWVAYRQFCECFLFPLYLEHFKGIPLQKMLTAWPDGIPASITASMLPWKTRLNPGTLMHVHLQAMVKSSSGKNISFSRRKLTNLLQHLESIVKGLRPLTRSTWNNYYDETILSKDYLYEKEKIFRDLLDVTNDHPAPVPHRAIDLGANDGYFSRIMAEQGTREVLAIDADAGCIENLYKARQSNILPLCIDLLNPSPAMGFGNKERAAFTDRFSADLVTALALVHHLTLSGNIPFPGIAAWLADFCTGYLIIEFVPLEDPKAQVLTKNKHRWHEPYTPEAFEKQLAVFFSIIKKVPVPGTRRILYLMKRAQLLKKQ